MIRSSLPVGDPKQRRQLGPQLGRELAATFRDNGGRRPKPGYPVPKEGSSTVLGGNRGQGNGLQPPRISVNNREEVAVALGLREGAHNVQVKSLETMVWDV